MKSLRLTVSLRDSIQESIMNSWKVANPEPEAEFKSLEKLRANLAFDCYNEVYGDIDFSVLPKEFINTESYIKVQLPNGDIEHFCFIIWDDKGVSSREYLPSSKTSKVELVLNKEEGPYARFKKAKEERKAALIPREERRAKLADFSHKVRQVLDSVNTTKQLVEAWPEIEEHLPSSIANPSKIQLPAVSIDSLNSQL